MSSSQSVYVTFIPSIDCCVQTYCLKLLVLWGTNEAFLSSVVQWNFQTEVHCHRHPTPFETKWADGSGVSQRCTHLGKWHVTKLFSVRCYYTLSSFSSSLVIAFLLPATLIRIFCSWRQRWWIIPFNLNKLIIVNNAVAIIRNAKCEQMHFLCWEGTKVRLLLQPYIKFKIQGSSLS